MGNIITVQRPELTEAERARRMGQIKEAAVKLLTAAELAKRKHT